MRRTKPPRPSQSCLRQSPRPRSRRAERSHRGRRRPRGRRAERSHRGRRRPRGRRAERSHRGRRRPRGRRAERSHRGWPRPGVDPRPRGPGLADLGPPGRPGRAGDGRNRRRGSHPGRRWGIPCLIVADRPVRNRGWPGQSAACPGRRESRPRGTLRSAPATRSGSLRYAERKRFDQWAGTSGARPTIRTGRWWASLRSTPPYILRTFRHEESERPARSGRLADSGRVD